MLAYILALAVGLGSLSVYLAAFFLPEVHRKSDFYWSGIGLFYGLMLWVCAGRITGGVLVGQIAGVALLGWFGWQTLTLRRELTPVAQQTDLPSKEEAAQTIRLQAESLKDNVQSNLSKVSLPAGISDLPQKLADLFATAKTQVMARLDAAKKPKAKPTPATPKSATPPVAATRQAQAPPIPTIEALDADSEASAIASATPTIEALDADSEASAIASATPTIEALDADSEASAIAEATSTTEMLKTYPEVEASKSSFTASKNIPPQVEVIFKVTGAPVSSSAKEDEMPSLKRANPPDTELVEEVVEDAETKNLPSSPTNMAG
ncbi:Ycf66 family protein [Argonema galeatum]|uniref:Ycf66 family protein n=1 Tax=Argonema galeatum TaxID=2942762 RepID=UPI002011E5FF|nr:Ycf66 family protein [Argonema galeatum]MCL1466306.1 hypothetical protein [Argonema galeatum A003/A1]